MLFERYWIFVASGLLVVALVVRLLLRERVSLQHSLAFLLFMVGMLIVAAFPSLTGRLSRLMGFDLPSNFFFAVLIAVLVLLHVGTVIALSRLETRTIALTQELGLIREQLGRVNAGAAGRAAGGVADRPAAPPPEPLGQSATPSIPPSSRS
jgi:hypothetical protein